MFGVKQMHNTLPVGGIRDVKCEARHWGYLAVY